METCRCFAVLSDVHGTAAALAAVLDELDVVSPDLVVFGGDLTWGPLPRETLRSRASSAQGRSSYAATPNGRCRSWRALANAEPARRPRFASAGCSIGTRTRSARFSRASWSSPWSRSTGSGRRASATDRRAANVELRQTDYDLAQAVDRYRATGDPLTEEMVELLERPPSPAEVVEDAEATEFAG